MSTNSCEVYLAFKGDDLVHDEITKELGISPTD